MARPKKDEGRAHTAALRLRLLPEHDELFRRAAKHAGINLSDWARERLIQAARKDLGISETGGGT